MKSRNIIENFRGKNCFSGVKIIEVPNPVPLLLDQYKMKIHEINCQITNPDGFQKLNDISTNDDNSNKPSNKITLPLINGKNRKNKNKNSEKLSKNTKNQIYKNFEIDRISPIKKLELKEKKGFYSNLDINLYLSTNETNSSVLTQSNNNLTKKSSLKKGLYPKIIDSSIMINKYDIPHPTLKSTQRSIKSINFLKKFLDIYTESDNYLKESSFIIRKKISLINKKYKKSDNNGVENYKKELSQNLMPKGEKNPQFYTIDNEMKFVEQSDHVLKYERAINKCDDLSAYKFRDLIWDKFGVNNNESKELQIEKKLEEKFINNQKKVVKILRNSKIQKKRVLENLKENN